jgi:hypothetical protein
MRRRLADEVGHGPRMRGGTLAGTLGLLVLAGLALLATLPGWARSATPNPATFRPVADSYVQADAAGTNYGT